MPELPEVETVRRGLKEHLSDNTQVSKIHFFREGLRNPFPLGKEHLVIGQPLLDVERRAKYLFFRFSTGVIVSHLGMTGSWRFKVESQAHDHLEMCLNDGRVLVYRDPRRFGQFDILSTSDLVGDRRFSLLGPEPLDQTSFTHRYLMEASRNRQVPVKSWIMDQRVVVGVGNIYASEALYWANIHPLMPAGSLSSNQAKRLVLSIRDVLEDALAFGGSTISDFRQAGGGEGYFQNQLFVYGADNEPCPRCDTLVTSTVLSGRSTYWCPSCQKLT